MLQRQSTIDEIEKLYQNLKSPDSQENLNR